MSFIYWLVAITAVPQLAACLLAYPVVKKQPQKIFPHPGQFGWNTGMQLTPPALGSSWSVGGSRHSTQAGHRNAEELVGDEYPARVIPFFEHHLS